MNMADVNLQGLCLLAMVHQIHHTDFTKMSRMVFRHVEYTSHTTEAFVEYISIAQIQTVIVNVALDTDTPISIQYFLDGLSIE